MKKLETSWKQVRIKSETSQRPEEVQDMELVNDATVQRYLPEIHALVQLNRDAVGFLHQPCNKIRKNQKIMQ